MSLQGRLLSQNEFRAIMLVLISISAMASRAAQVKALENLLLQEKEAQIQIAALQPNQEMDEVIHVRDK